MPPAVAIWLGLAWFLSAFARAVRARDMRYQLMWISGDLNVIYVMVMWCARTPQAQQGRWCQNVFIGGWCIDGRRHRVRDRATVRETPTATRAGSSGHRARSTGRAMGRADARARSRSLAQPHSGLTMNPKARSSVLMTRPRAVAVV